MGFTLEDKGKIRKYLGVDFSRQNEINDLCDQVESFSESGGVQITLKILSDLDSIERERLSAAKGIIKIDVIQYKEDRNCDLSRYERRLVSDLAKSIGYNSASSRIGSSIFDQGNIKYSGIRSKGQEGGSC